MGTDIIRGKTHDEKFASANQALKQLERRIAARSIVAPLTPIVIVGYCDKDDNGVIIRSMFPVSCFVTKISLFIEKLEDEEFLKKNILEFYIESRQIDGTVISKKFMSKKLDIITLSNFKIPVDSRITVSINTKASGIYWGLVLEPEMPIKRKVDVSDIELLSPVEREMIEE